MLRGLGWVFMHKFDGVIMWLYVGSMASEMLKGYDESRPREGKLQEGKKLLAKTPPEENYKELSL